VTLKEAARTVAIPVLPALVAAWLLLRGAGPSYGAAVLAVAVTASLALAVSARTAHRRRLGTVASVLTAYREGDFSTRARLAASDGSLQEVLTELNQLGEMLREQRLGEMEAWALLHKVMAEVDVVVLAFDDGGHVRLANDAAARLLGKPSAAVLGADAAALGLAELLEGSARRITKEPIALGRGPWEVRRGAFRLSGQAHTLLVLSDVSSALRENERDAWRKLIRVMGHEINNSLAPIRSITDALSMSLQASPRPDDLDEDLRDGLGVIGRRSEALGRFMASYAKLARLPPPRLAKVDVGTLVRKIATLERRTSVEVLPGPELSVEADADQLEQVLINLIKNGAEAALPTQGGVRALWRERNGFAEIAVEDEGPGISDTTNLFVPFFTTKPEGTGIGLLLSRQIVEAHQGQLSLTSRSDRQGAVATVRLPMR
jgi:two-component system nitrogen regulation sensor histidine kinase NtrY